MSTVTSSSTPVVAASSSKKDKKSKKRTREEEEGAASKNEEEEVKQPTPSKQNKTNKADEADPDDGEGSAAETEEERRARKEAKRKRKEEKKAKKAAAAGEVPSPSPSPSSSPDSVATSPAASPSPSPQPARSSAAASSSSSPFDFYVPHSSALPSSTSDTAVTAFRRQHHIAIVNHAASASADETVMNDVGDVNVPLHLRPILSFDQLTSTFAAASSSSSSKCKLPHSLSVAPIFRNFERPSPIQAQCWPVLFSGHNAVAIAETGSGKTLGFVLPCLLHIFSLHPQLASPGGNRRNNTPLALILAPTRELAQQIQTVVDDAVKHISSSAASSSSSNSASLINSVCIYGGVDKYTQRKSMQAGMHIIVACPGRLLAMTREDSLSLASVSFVVLDEADRMLDMGFEPDIRAIMAQLSPRRQTVMFSATWPTVIQKLARSFLTGSTNATTGGGYIQMTLGRQSGDATELKASARVKQTVQVMEDHEKDRRLLALLDEFHRGKPANQPRIIIFCLYKKEVPRVSGNLHRAGWPNLVLSGDLSQAERERTIMLFKQQDNGSSSSGNGKIANNRIMIATDVAARGLDVKGVTHVINYTFPLTVEDYIHRIGRTGRGVAASTEDPTAKTGQAYTFFTKAEKHLVGELMGVLQESNEPVPEQLTKLSGGVFTKKKEHGMYGAFFKELAPGAPTKPTKVTFD